MAELTDTQESMIEIVAAADADQPMVLTALTPDGGNVIAQYGDAEQDPGLLVQLAALQLIHLNGYADAEDIGEVAADVAEVAERLLEANEYAEYRQAK